MRNVSRIISLAAALAAAAITMPLTAGAGPAEKPDDRAAVEERLHHMGFVEWRSLRWDHGYWKINDARRENGHVYDLKLEDGTFDIVRLVRERT